MSAKPNPTLPRELNLLALVLLTISAITPASSMFIEMPGALQAAGTSIGAVLLISGLIGLIMALVYSELSSAYPSSGGEYVIVWEVLGAPLAYVVIILNLCVMIFIPAVLGLGAGQYFSLVLPEIPPLYAALIVIAISTAFGILNIRLNAWATGAFLLIELACLIYFSYVGTTHIAQPLSILTAVPFVSLQDGELTAATISLIATSVAIVIFAFNGYEQAIYLAENTYAPRNTVPRAIMISLIFGLLFEAIPTISLLLSSTNIHDTLSSASPYLDYIGVVVGEKAKVLMALAISVAVLNACIVNILMTARFIFSSARDGFLGTSSLGGHLGAIYEPQGAPWVATLAVGIAGALACYLSVYTLTVVTGTGLVFIYFLLCICVIVGRRNKTTSRAQFRPTLNPLVAAVGMIALLCVLIANWLDPTTGRPSVLAALGEGALGLLLYGVARFLRQRIKPVILE